MSALANVTSPPSLTFPPKALHTRLLAFNASIVVCSKFPDPSQGLTLNFVLTGGSTILWHAYVIQNVDIQ